MAGSDEKTHSRDDSSEPDVEHTDLGGHHDMAITQTRTNPLHEYREKEGYVIDDSEGGEGIKYASDGHTRLIPQPSDDPLDPLNWTRWKKHAILFVVAAAAFLPDYGSATGAVTLELQAEYVMSICPRRVGRGP